MRKELSKIKEKRMRFYGIFERFGTKKNWHGFPEKTVLLHDIKRLDTEEIVTDHLWFNHTKGFQSLGDIKEGDCVVFDARVKSYIKGYRGYDFEKSIESPVEKDWKLSNLSKFEIVKENNIEKDLEISEE